MRVGWFCDPGGVVRGVNTPLNAMCIDIGAWHECNRLVGCVGCGFRRISRRFRYVTDPRQVDGSCGAPYNGDAKTLQHGGVHARDPYANTRSLPYAIP